jgi:hypothetical protein
MRHITISAMTARYGATSGSLLPLAVVAPNIAPQSHVGVEHGLHGFGDAGVIRRQENDMKCNACGKMNCGCDKGGKCSCGKDCACVKKPQGSK